MVFFNDSHFQSVSYEAREKEIQVISGDTGTPDLRFQHQKIWQTCSHVYTQKNKDKPFPRLVKGLVFERKFSRLAGLEKR